MAMRPTANTTRPFRQSGAWQCAPTMDLHGPLLTVRHRDNTQSQEWSSRWTLFKAFPVSGWHEGTAYAYHTQWGRWVSSLPYPTVPIPSASDPAATGVPRAEPPASLRAVRRVRNLSESPDNDLGLSTYGRDVSGRIPTLVSDAI